MKQRFFLFLLFLPIELYPVSTLDDSPTEKVLKTTAHIANTSTNQALPSSWLIFFHQQVLSLADGPRSHFYPSSSEYMRQALMAHGITGFFLGMDRLLRENSDPWVYPIVQVGFSTRKFDPVPMNSRARMSARSSDE